MEKRVLQMYLEGLPKTTNMAVAPQVTNSIPGLLPDVLTWIQVGTAWRETEHIELFMRVDKRARFAFVPAMQYTSKVC